jgi:hypothetical protein
MPTPLRIPVTNARWERTAAPSVGVVARNAGRVSSSVHGWTPGELGVRF